jgi:DUF1365 family protein
MRSHLLEGTVRHRRSERTGYALAHDVYYVALDLDELDHLPRTIPILGRNRRAIVEFRDADHLPEPATDLARDLRAHLAASGFDAADWRIQLVTNLRVFGYVFNPASFYLCRDAAGGLRVVVVEVHNTYGGRHLYTLAGSDAPSADRLRDSMPKAFFVSPFIGMAGEYRVAVRDEDDSLTIGIALSHDGRPVLSASLALRRRPLTTMGLLWMLIRHPLMTQRTIGLIHWHALRLWLRRVPFHRHGAARMAVAGREGAR